MSGGVAEAFEVPFSLALLADSPLPCFTFINLTLQRRPVDASVGLRYPSHWQQHPFRKMHFRRPHRDKSFDLRGHLTSTDLLHVLRSRGGLGSAIFLGPASGVAPTLFYIDNTLKLQRWPDDASVGVRHPSHWQQHPFKGYLP